MKHIYITTCDPEGGIHHCLLEDGALQFRELLPVDRGMYTVLDGQSYYCLLRDLEQGDRFGGLISGKIDGSGRLLPPSHPISSKGIVPCHLAVVGEDIYVVNYLSGNLVRLPEQVAAHSGHSLHPTRQEAPHTHFVTSSPDGKYILCADLGVDTIFVYDRALNPVSQAQVPPGSGCRHLVFSSCGAYVYCVNELSSDVAVFSFRSGVLQLEHTVAAIPDHRGSSTAAAIRLSDGFLYVSHRGADCISVFRAEGRWLTLLANVPCGGHSPRDFDIADGYLICANEGGTVSVMKLKEGIPAEPRSYALPGNPLCVTVGEG